MADPADGRTMRAHLETLAEYPPVQGASSFDMSNVVREFINKEAVAAPWSSIQRTGGRRDVGRGPFAAMLCYGPTEAFNIETFKLADFELGG